MAKIVREYNYDVAVIGGGTAGTACAIVCGENGLRTVVAALRYLDLCAPLCLII